MIEIRQGDCRDVLAEFEPESFSACICDPPYHLVSIVKRFGAENAAPAKSNGATGVYSRASKGFMGKTWDGGDVAFQPETWAAVYRVLKPGAHLLAFGGTRTYHRLACAIEDAGFEIRDTIMWLYGCLSDDTEILVDGQWEPYYKAIAGRRVLCYNAEHDEYSWQPIQDLFVYEYDDTAFRVHSDRTDQIVSRKHRCLVERGGALVFELAEEAARQRQARVPILEDLPALLGSLSLPDERAGNEEQSLRSSVRQGPTLEAPAALSQANRRSQGQDDRLRGMWHESLETGCLAEAGQAPGLFEPVQRRPPWRGMGEARAQGASGMVAGSRRAMAAADDWIGEPGLEGRCDVLPQGRQLQADQVRALPTRVPADGQKRWLCHATSADRGESDRAVLAQDRGCPSRGSRSAVKWAGQPDALREQSRSQALRASRHTRTDLARIEPVHYRGIVWCVRVPTGAFVARRNGKIFVTGNSGFPKSHDVSKAIDRAAGAEREVIGSRPIAYPDTPSGYTSFSAKSSPGAGSIWGSGDGTVDKGRPITAPETEAARAWQGWGTSLKPATELVCVARKPPACVTSDEIHGLTGWDHWHSSRSDGEYKIVTARALHPGASSFRARLDKHGREVAREDLGAYEPFAIDAVAANVLRHGTGALNIDACRVGVSRDVPASLSKCKAPNGIYGDFGGGQERELDPNVGRWPANVCHDGSPEVLEAFAKFGSSESTGHFPRNSGGIGTDSGIYGNGRGRDQTERWLGDTGTAARFFKEASFEPGEIQGARQCLLCGQLPSTFDECQSADTAAHRSKTKCVPTRFAFHSKAPSDERVGSHPTVKPVALMEWLVRLVTPTGGRVLDPFCGTGSTLVACDRLGFDALGIEQDAQTVADAHEKLRRMRARRMIGEARSVETPEGQLGLPL